MSRIGKNPIVIPEGVEISLDGQDVKVKGKLGELNLSIHKEVSIAIEEVANDDGKTSKIVRLSPKSDTIAANQIWPTMRTLVNNMVIGVSEGFKKKLELHGVGYRVTMKGKDLVLSLGFSHDVNFTVPEGIKVELDKQTGIIVSGIDKQLVGQVAAKIRSFRKPEPYKGKGIRYSDEYVIRKEGKKK